jgi:hypothetical protein
MTFRNGWVWLVVCTAFLMESSALAQVTVPEQPPANAKPQVFKDGHFGVRFEVPEGWSVARKDGEVSTFHLDARSAPAKARMRGVAAIQFNPYPYTTFSGALFYYSVTPHVSDVECARQATGPAAQDRDVQDIGGMGFAHGHDEHGNVCVEARDEVYTAYRKGSCYRFDLAMNTFCSVSSGIADMTQSQLEQIDQRMADILSTVKLDWEKTGPHPVPAPKVPVTPQTLPGETHTALLQHDSGPSVSSGRRGSTGR